MKKYIHFILFIACLFFSVSCNQEKTGWKGTIEIRDGVVIVKNPDEPMHDSDAVSIQWELTVGANEDNEESLINRIASIDVDKEGNIFILDTISANIKVFDRNGKFTGTIGKFGQGPGEMQRPNYIQITHQDEIAVFDPLTKRFLYFSHDGDFLRQVSTARQRYPSPPIKFDSKGNLYASSVPPPPVGGPRLVKFDSNFELLFVISQIDSQKSGEKREFKVLQPFDCCAVSQNDQIVWGNSKEYELKVLNPGGNLIKLIKKDHTPKKLSQTEKEIWGEKAFRLSIAKAGFKMILPDYFPAFHDISIDETGRIFVRTYERFEEQENYYYFDVFDSEGKYIAQIPIRSLPRVWKSGKFYTIEADEEGFQTVKRHNVTWNY